MAWYGSAVVSAQTTDSDPQTGVVDGAKDGGLPANTKALAKKAAEAFTNQNWELARESYEEMLRVEPFNALAWANLGAVEQQSGRMTEAVQSFEQAVRFNATLVQSWIALGLAYAERGDLYLAISALSRAIHEDPLDARAHHYLALVSKRLGWTQSAQAELERSIELNPNYGTAHFNLALTYLDQRPPAVELARRHYERALGLGVKADEIVERKLAGNAEEEKSKAEGSAPE